MGFGKSAGTLLRGAAWRLTGSASLGRSLTETAASDDEDAAGIASMLLTKGGAGAVPLVRDAIDRGNGDLVTILVSIGDDEAESALRELKSHSDPSVAEAASTGLDQLSRIRAHEEGGGPED